MVEQAPLFCSLTSEVCECHVLYGTGVAGAVWLWSSGNWSSGKRSGGLAVPCAVTSCFGGRSGSCGRGSLSRSSGGRQQVTARRHGEPLPQQRAHASFQGGEQGLGGL